MTAGAAVKTAANFFLVGKAEIGIKGAAYATLICYFVTAVIALWAITKKAGISFDAADTVLRPLIPAVAMGFSVSAVYESFAEKTGSLAVIIGILVGIFVYFAISALFYKKIIMSD